MSKRTLVASLGLALSFVVAVPAKADSVATARELYQKVCRNCHGPTGKGMASFPSLLGHDAEFLISRLESYRAGERVGNNSAIMIPVAADLTDEEIEGLAEYIAGELDRSGQPDAAGG